MNRLAPILLLEVVLIGISAAIFLLWDNMVAIFVYIIGSVILTPLILRTVKEMSIPSTRSDTSVPNSAIGRYPLPLPTELEESIRLIAQQSKIEAIKKVRELTGVGLKEAKDYVERLPTK